MFWAQSTIRDYIRACLLYTSDAAASNGLATSKEQINYNDVLVIMENNVVDMITMT